MICFGLCFGTIIIAAALTGYVTSVSILSGNQAQVVEGQVHNLSSFANGKAESFTVEGVQFSYSEYSQSRGFHNVSSLGGPIREGLQVKIWYARIEGDPSEPVILRLDIAK
jgi:hypothetical protein